MAKIKNNCSSTIKIVVNSILSSKNINATKVVETFLDLGLDLEKILRVVLYFTDEIEKPVLQSEVIDEEGRRLHLTNYDFIANTVRYKFSRKTTRWFRTDEEAERWLTDENRCANAGYAEKYGTYAISATAQVEDFSMMSFDVWERLEPADKHDKFCEKG